MQWKTVLNQWNTGIIPIYPTHIRKRFIWRTNCERDHGIYKEEFIVDSRLPTKMNIKPFLSHIQQSDHKYATAFPNLSGDTVLVVPMPKKNRFRTLKNYSTIKSFIDHASLTQQKVFWKRVYKEITKFRRVHKNVWVSTHGTEVAYLHVRISSTPKYYEGSLLADI